MVKEKKGTDILNGNRHNPARDGKPKSGLKLSATQSKIISVQSGRSLFVTLYSMMEQGDHFPASSIDTVGIFSSREKAVAACRNAYNHVRAILEKVTIHSIEREEEPTLEHPHGEISFYAGDHEELYQFWINEMNLDEDVAEDIAIPWEGFDGDGDE